MTDRPLEVIEIYPNILVYKNLFKDINESYKILKDSTIEQENGIFNKWSDWSIFGKYLNPIFPGFNSTDKYGNVKNFEITNELQEKQKNFIIEMIDNFNIATEDYIKRYNVDIDLKSISINEEGKEIPTWRWVGGVVAMYHISNEIKEYRMNYHSDYQREKHWAPGYKFVITCTIYYNDDYDGGEVDFSMGNKLVKYKPEAGDVLVFPSGHPDYLTEDGSPYLHAVMPSYNNNKFFSRWHWQKYQKGTDEWYEKEKEFGKEVWSAMQPELEEQFKLSHPQRGKIDKGVRLK